MQQPVEQTMNEPAVCLVWFLTILVTPVAFAGKTSYFWILPLEELFSI